MPKILIFQDTLLRSSKVLTDLPKVIILILHIELMSSTIILRVKDIHRVTQELFILLTSISQSTNMMNMATIDMLQ